MSWPKRLKKQLSRLSMPAASTSSATPSAVNSRMACGSSVIPTPSSFTSGARSYTVQGMPRRWRFSASERPQMPPPTMAISPASRDCVRFTMARRSGVAALRRYIEQRRRAGAHRIETTLQRRRQFGRLLDFFAVAAACLDDLLVVRRGLELGQWHHVGLGGGAVGIDIEGGLAHGVPGMIVGHDGQRRQAIGAADVMVGQGIAEHVGAVAHGDNHVAVGRRELGAEGGAETEAEAAGQHVAHEGAVAVEFEMADRNAELA